MSLLLLAAYATGVALVQFVSPWDPPVQCIIIGSLTLLWALLRSSWSGWIPFLALLCVAGFINAAQHLEPAKGDDSIVSLADNSFLNIEGELLTAEKRSADGYRLLVEVHQATRNRLSADVSGVVMLYVKSGELSARPGQIIRWRSRLRRPTTFGNPGEFDYPLYLAARRIYVTSFVESTDDIVVLFNHPRSQHRIMENLRQALASEIEQAIPGQGSGYLKSLLLGLRDGIDQEQQQQLAATGVAHLFAISGLHFGLLALMLYTISRWFYTRSQRLTLWCPPQRILPLVLLVPLFTYMLLTGSAWGTRRAFLMVAIVAVLVTLSRRTRPLTLLATVALSLLIMNPLALFQPGFQLSFCGVAGIIIWLPVWQKPFENLSGAMRWPLAMILSTAAATLATAPALLWFFNQFSPAGLLSNLVAIPLIAWGSVPLGLLSLLTLPLVPQLAHAGLSCSAELATWATTFAAAISQWPGFEVITCYLTFPGLILLVFTLYCLAPDSVCRWRWPVRLALPILLAGCLWLVPDQDIGISATALSVGQGDATLLSIDGGEHFLVDGGGLPGSSIDTGEQLVAPALGRMGVKRLRGVVLTHNHPDHSLGLTYILKRFPVDAFYTAVPLEELSVDLHAALKQQEIPVHQLAAGWTQLDFDREQALHLFVPTQTSRDINERSIAVYLEQRRNGVLLTADMGKDSLQQLLAGGLPGRVSLLKLPHHGSRNAHPEAFIDAFLPEVVFASAGRDNVYGFPHPEVVETCNKRRLPLYRTDQSGMLAFHLVDEHWQVKTAINN